MKTECFLDANILIYAATGRKDEPRKFRIASDLVEKSNFGLSAQVLAEFFVNVTRKSQDRPSLSDAEVDLWIRLLDDYPIVAVDSSLVHGGVANARKFKISYWDGAILAAAERSGAPILYTEDLNHGQMYGPVKVLNPFRPT